VAEGVPLFTPSIAAKRSLLAAAALAAALDGDAPLPLDIDAQVAAGGGSGGGGGPPDGCNQHTAVGVPAGAAGGVESRVQGWLADAQPAGLAAGQIATASSAGARASSMMAVPASCSAPNPLARTLVLPQALQSVPVTAPSPYPPAASHPGDAAVTGHPQGSLADKRTGDVGLDDEFINISLAQVIPAEELTLIERIGQGAEGRVFLGRWNHIEVAAKEFFTGNENGGDGADTADGQMKAHVSRSFSGWVGGLVSGGVFGEVVGVARMEGGGAFWIEG